MEHSPEIGEVAKALITVQSQVGKVRKDGRGHNYVYATLDHTIDVVRPILVDAGLAISQCMGADGGDVLTTTLIHGESGQWIRSTYSLNAAGMKGVNDAQQMGAGITYARRYCLLAILNIAPGDDDDAASLTKKKPPTPPMPPAKPPEKMTAAQGKKLHAAGSLCYGSTWDDVRPKLVSAITKGRTESSNDLYKDEAGKLIDGIEKKHADNMAANAGDDDVPPDAGRERGGE
jgi:hypothetical protein